MLELRSIVFCALCLLVMISVQFFSSREAVGASECHRLLEVSSWTI